LRRIAPDKPVSATKVACLFKSSGVITQSIGFATDIAQQPKTTKTEAFKNNKHVYGPIKMFIVFKFISFRRFLLFADFCYPGV